MIIREATTNDITAMQIVRNAVKENVLSTPALVTDDDCNQYINRKGKGWVCEINNNVIAFAIADLEENSIWALFIDPHFERQGIGRLLHDTMLNWYFSKTPVTVWLTTAPGTRAEFFYRKAGWLETGKKANGEIRFEMTHENWIKPFVKSN